MDAIECIRTRRSVRQYGAGAVPEEALKEILESAMCAPSAGNEQPWHFVVLKDREILKRIPSFHPYAKMAPSASVAILVCGEPRLEKHKGFWVQDCAAATQNLLLAAHALGFGGVWVGVHPKEEREQGFRDLLNIPAHVVPFALVPLGAPAEKTGQVPRYRADRVHADRWPS